MNGLSNPVLQTMRVGSDPCTEMGVFSSTGVHTVPPNPALQPMPQSRRG